MNGIDDEWKDGWSFDEWNDDWSSVGWHESWAQTYDISARSFSLGCLDVSATSCPKRFESSKMNLDTGSAVNTFSLNFALEGAKDMEDSVGLPVVNGFRMVEVGNLKDTMKMDCSDLCMKDILVYTKFCAVLTRFLPAKEDMMVDT